MSGSCFPRRQGGFGFAGGDSAILAFVARDVMVVVVVEDAPDQRSGAKEDRHAIDSISERDRVEPPAHRWCGACLSHIRGGIFVRKRGGGARPHFLPSFSFPTLFSFPNAALVSAVFAARGLKRQSKPSPSGEDSRGGHPRAEPRLRRLCNIINDGRECGWRRGR
jgi:hypothetical protein